MLAVSCLDFSVFGRPIVDKAQVVGTVLEHTRDQKKLAFWYRRRKSYSRTHGSKQPVTIVKILDVLYAGPRVVIGNKEKI